MSNIIRRFQPSPKTTVCFKNSCVTVYDDVAKIVNVIVATVSLVAKALK